MGIAEQTGRRPYTGGGAASPQPSSREAETVSGLKRRLAEQDLEIARLKRELAARPLPETVTRGNAPGNARLTPAAKQRRYRERKKSPQPT
jgi:hypothetical protein